MSTVNTTKRNDSLDYLRGLAATGVMIYHMNLLCFGEVDASTVLAKVKIFAVSIFYVLSGLTLYIANKKSALPEKNSMIEFYLKRFFRIFPLMWLAVFFTYLLKSEPEFYHVKRLIVNFFILPGMIRPDGFVANGAWSIGNELFFYLFFPLFFYLNKIKKTYFYLSLLVLLATFCLFTFVLMDPTIQLGYQWSKFVNPFNQFLYFGVGIFVATLPMPSELLKKMAPYLIIICLLLVIYYPVHGEPILLVTGINRILLSSLIMFICYLFYISDFNFLPAFLRWTLKYLGDTSYSIYLLHPLVFILVERINHQYFTPNPYLIIVSTVVITLPLSGLVYNTFEKYFLNYGKKYIDNRRNKLTIK